MKTREQLNLENYQQAVKFAGNFAEPFKQEYLAEAERRYQFDQNTTNRHRLGSRASGFASSQYSDRFFVFCLPSPILLGRLDAFAHLFAPRNNAPTANKISY